MKFPLVDRYQHTVSIAHAVNLGETVTPNPFHPLGVKGVGEAGCNGAPPAVANAVMDALALLGIDHIDMPYTAPKLWEAIRAAPGKRSG